MNSPGLLIAVGVVTLYALIGPLVLFGIYTLFDSMTLGKERKDPKAKTYLENKDPALWTDQEITLYFTKGEYWILSFWLAYLTLIRKVELFRSRNNKFSMREKGCFQMKTSILISCRRLELTFPNRRGSFSKQTLRYEVNDHYFN